MTLQRKEITREEWEKVLNGVDIRKQDMNKLVMNYLVTECYEEAVKNFIMESGTEPGTDLENLQVRANIRKKILCGEIDNARASIYDSYEQLRERRSINFWLTRQIITERIRNGDVEEAVQIGQQNFSRCAVLHPSIQEAIERTFCLLAFEDPSNSPLAKLLDVSERLETANAVSRAILSCEGQEGEKLDNMLKELLLVQDDINEMAAYPKINISSGILKDPVL